MMKNNKIMKMTKMKIKKKIIELRSINNLVALLKKYCKLCMEFICITLFLEMII